MIGNLDCSLRPVIRRMYPKEESSPLIENFSVVDRHFFVFEVVPGRLRLRKVCERDSHCRLLVAFISGCNRHQLPSTESRVDRVFPDQPPVNQTETALAGKLPSSLLKNHGSEEIRQS